MLQSEMSRFYRRMSPKLALSGHFVDIRKELEEEVIKSYYLSLQKSIVDYVLLDNGERKRLRIHSIPVPYPRR